MPDIGPLSPNRTQVPITYPDVPANFVNKLNELITALNQTGYHLNSSSGNVQTFMGKANGAVQNVVGISQGQATQALLETWLFSLIDGNQTQTGMSGVATHLNTAASTLQGHVQSVNNGMQSLATVQSNGGVAPSDSAQQMQSDINALTNELNNISMALDGAAKLINAINSDWPTACATGFTPGSTYPTFAPNAFNPLNGKQMNMVGNLDTDGDQAAEKVLQALQESGISPELQEEIEQNLTAQTQKIIEEYDAGIVSASEAQSQIDALGNLTEYYTPQMINTVLKKNIEKFLPDGGFVVPFNQGRVFLFPGASKSEAIAILEYGPNASPSVFPSEEAYLASEGLLGKVTQVGPETFAYNCHGYTFTDGALWVNEGVDGILKRQGFALTNAPAIGDVVAYRDATGQITHTGVVSSVSTDGSITVESKFGMHGLYSHQPGTITGQYGDWQVYHTSNPDGRILTNIIETIESAQ